MSLINFAASPVKELLPLLLKDKTTGQNIKWAIDSYKDFGIVPTDEIQPSQVSLIRPRTEKSKDDQKKRTKQKAEVFTPTWICAKMNGYCDKKYFGTNVDPFGVVDETAKTWQPNPYKIQFSSGKSWQEYVASRRLEITCGEAPFLASRYDTTTGEIIPVKQRVGILDRKLRIVNENAGFHWFFWAQKACQSTYGFESQGDNLLIARINLLLTFCDFFRAKCQKELDKKVLLRFAEIISYNIWQMDGLKDTVPFANAGPKYEQLNLGFFNETVAPKTPVYAKIMDWEKHQTVVFHDLRR